MDTQNATARYMSIYEILDCDSFPEAERKLGFVAAAKKKGWLEQETVLVCAKYMSVMQKMHFYCPVEFENQIKMVAEARDNGWLTDASLVTFIERCLQLSKAVNKPSLEALLREIKGGPAVGSKRARVSGLEPVHLC